MSLIEGCLLLAAIRDVQHAAQILEEHAHAFERRAPKLAAALAELQPMVAPLAALAKTEGDALQAALIDADEARAAATEKAA